MKIYYYKKSTSYYYVQDMIHYATNNKGYFYLRCTYCILDERRKYNLIDSNEEEFKEHQRHNFCTMVVKTSNNCNICCWIVINNTESKIGRSNDNYYCSFNTEFLKTRKCFYVSSNMKILLNLETPSQFIGGTSYEHMIDLIESNPITYSIIVINVKTEIEHDAIYDRITNDLQNASCYLEKIKKLINFNYYQYTCIYQIRRRMIKRAYK
jgi:hypothetical protein